MNNNLDKLVQQWACTQRSDYSGKPAECGHHHFSRRHEVVRYFLPNIIPLTLKEHRLLHDGKITIENKFEDMLTNMVNKGLKNYLLENNLTKKEWEKQCKQNIIDIMAENKEFYNDRV